MGEHVAGDAVVKTVRVTLVALGVAMMAFGVVSAVTAHSFNAFRHIAFLIVALALHDGFLLPVFLLVGFLVHRFVPARDRAIVQGALIVTAAVTVVSIPFVLGYGRIPDNTSALPRNYPGGYGLVIGAVWLVALLVVVARRMQHHRTVTAPVGAPDGAPGGGDQLTES
jgi:hypothetical protein